MYIKINNFFAHLKPQFKGRKISKTLQPYGDLSLQIHNMK